MKTLTMLTGQISEIVSVSPGTRITSSGSGYIEWTPGTLSDARNAASWTTWAKGSSAGYMDSARQMCIRATATGSMTVTIAEGEADRLGVNAYWEEDVPVLSTDANGNTVLVGPDGVFFGGVFAKSGVAASVTGTLTETVLGTVIIPAGTLGINGQVEIETAWSVTASANNKIVKAKWNNANIHANTLTNSGKVQTHNRVCNRGSTASQFSAKLYSVFGYGADTNDTTFAVDTETTDVTITFTGVLTNTGETITLESYLIKVWP